MSALVRRVLDDVTSFAPAPATWRVAVRASSTMLTSLLVLWMIGHIEWSLYAAFGTFGSVFGTTARYPTRWRVQTALVVVLTCCVGIGAVVGLSDARRWIAVPVTGLVAVVSAHFSDRYRVSPPGPLFMVFAVSACAAVPTTPGMVPAAMLVSAGTGLLAVLLGVGEVRRHPHEPEPPPAPARHTPLLACGGAVSLSAGITTALGIAHPYWAAIGAAAPFSAPTPRTRAVRGLHRMLGTAVGLLVAALLLWPSLPIPAIILLVAALQGLTELVIKRNYGVALLFITPLALLVMHMARPEPLDQMLTSRLLETAIGIVIGVGAALLADRHVRRRAHARLRRVGLSRARRARP